MFFGTSLDKDFDDLELIDEFSGGDELEFQRYQGKDGSSLAATGGLAAGAQRLGSVAKVWGVSVS